VSGDVRARKIRGNMKESAYRAGAAGRPVTLVSASTGARGSAARASRARASRRPSFNTDGRTGARATRRIEVRAQRIKTDVQFPVFKIMFKMSRSTHTHTCLLSHAALYRKNAR